MWLLCSKCPQQVSTTSVHNKCPQVPFTCTRTPWPCSSRCWQQLTTVWRFWCSASATRCLEGTLRPCTLQRVRTAIYEQAWCFVKQADTGDHPPIGPGQQCRSLSLKVWKWKILALTVPKIPANKGVTHYDLCSGAWLAASWAKKVENME